MSDLVIDNQTYNGIQIVGFPIYGGGTDVFKNKELWNWVGFNVEKIKTLTTPGWTALSDTGYNTWTPTTTATDIIASATTDTEVLDMSQYDYFLHWRFRCDFVYQAGTTMKATIIRECQDMWQAIFRRPANATDQANSNFNANGVISLYTAAVTVYNHGTSGNLNMGYSAAYGVYATTVNATFSNSTTTTPTLTIKSPLIRARCEASQFSTTSAAAVDKSNSKLCYDGELLRVPTGASARSMYNNLNDIYVNSI